MEALKKYLLKNFEQLFVLLILVSVAGINYFIPYKLAFLIFFHSHPAGRLLSRSPKSSAWRRSLCSSRIHLRVPLSRVLHAHLHNSGPVDEYPDLGQFLDSDGGLGRTAHHQTHNGSRAGA